MKKDAYLQDLGRRFAEATGRPVTPLTEDALSRLRRFYSRRSFADLKLESMPTDDLSRTLRSLGEAIKDHDRHKDVVGALLRKTTPSCRSSCPASTTPRSRRT